MAPGMTAWPASRAPVPAGGCRSPAPPAPGSGRGRPPRPGAAGGRDRPGGPRPAGCVHQVPGFFVAAGAVERQHPLSPQPFPERVGPRQGVELGGQLGVAAAGQLGLNPLLGGRQPGLLQPGRLGPGHGGVGHVGQGRPSPQRQRLSERRRRLIGRAPPLLVPGGGNEGLEAGGVEGSGWKLGEVAGRPGDDDVVVARLPQRLAQARHEHLQRMGRPGRRFAAPEVLGEALGRDHPVGRGQQQGEDSPSFVENLHGPEDAELHAGSTPLPPLATGHRDVTNPTPARVSGP